MLFGAGYGMAEAEEDAGQDGEGGEELERHDGTRADERDGGRRAAARGAARSRRRS